MVALLLAHSLGASALAGILAGILLERARVRWMHRRWLRQMRETLRQDKQDKRGMV